jgi:hypothetical protein
MSKPLTPTRARLVLVSLLVLLSGIGVAVFITGYNILSDFSNSSKTLAAEAQASNSSLQGIITTKAELERNADIVDRASLIVAESRSYEYQDIANNVLPAYASQAGLVITSISFDNPQPTAGTTVPAVPGVTTAVPTGIKSMNITIAIKNPVEYTRMLTFIHYIEQSLFIMHIKQITLSKSNESSSGGQVSSDILTMEVYVR